MRKIIRGKISWENRRGEIKAEKLMGKNKRGKIKRET